MSEAFEYFCEDLEKRAIKKGLFDDKHVNVWDWQFKFREAYDQRNCIWTDVMHLYLKAVAINTVFYHTGITKNITVKTFVHHLKQTELNELTHIGWYEGADEAAIGLLLDSFEKCLEAEADNTER